MSALSRGGSGTPLLLMFFKQVSTLLAEQQKHILLLSHSLSSSVIPPAVSLSPSHSSGYKSSAWTPPYLLSALSSSASRLLALLATWCQHAVHPECMLYTYYTARELSILISIYFNLISICRLYLATINNFDAFCCTCFNTCPLCVCVQGQENTGIFL